LRLGGDLNITRDDLANQDIKGFILPCHLTASYSQEFFSRKAAQLLRQQAEKQAMLYTDSERRGIVALEDFCLACVSSCIRSVPDVAGESRRRTQKLLSHRFENFNVVKFLYLLTACSNKPRFTLWISQADADAIAAFKPWTSEWMNALHTNPPFGISTLTGHSFKVHNPLAVDLNESMLPSGEVLHCTARENIQYICALTGGLVPGGLKGNREQVHFCLVNPDGCDMDHYEYPAEFSSEDILHPYTVPRWQTAEIHIVVKYCREIGLTPVVHLGTQAHLRLK
jgi:hypothetical protein